MAGLSIIKYQIIGQEKIYSGKPIDTESAKEWVKKLNKEYPNIRHWIEAYPN